MMMICRGWVVAKSVLSFQTTTASSTPHQTTHRIRCQTNPKYKGRPQWQRIEESELVLENNSNAGEAVHKKGGSGGGALSLEKQDEDNHKKKRQHDA